MKTFSSLKQLLDYCSTCPVCHNKRKIDISCTGYNIVHKSFSYQNYLKLVTKLCLDDSEVCIAKIEFTLDCDNNSYTQNINPKHFDLLRINELLEKEDIDFTVYANCICECSVNSTDIILKNGVIANIAIEQETIHISDEIQSYQLFFDYEDKSLAVKETTNPNSKNGKYVRLPHMKLDYRYQKDIINKLKVMMAFS